MKSWYENFGGTKMTIGVGVSLFIGGAASIYLLLQSAKLLSKVSQRKIPHKKKSDKCVHCAAKVELDKLKEFVTCKGCDELACHNQKCSDFVYGLNVWECARCQKNRVVQQRAGEWLLKQLNQMRDNDEVIKLNKESILNNKDEVENLNAFVSREQRDKVRQFIEELLAKLVNGPLDDVSVGQLSHDDNCLPLVGPIPSNVTHQELKLYIQGICEDIINLPSKFDFSGVPPRHEDPLPYFEPKKYEQLLATAVLNKMTDFNQSPNDKSSQYNSSGVHSDVELDSNHNQLNGKAVIDLMVKRDEVMQKSNSPTIERLNSKVADDETHLSDYVESHFVPLPDFSQSDSANEDVDMQSVISSNGTDGTWEENWLFKKRKLKTENQSIAMLVPSPTEDVRTLIGDKNADETSDLSENSDIEGDGAEESEAKVTANTKVIPITTTHDSLKSMQSLTSLEAGPGTITEAKNNILLIDDSSYNEPEVTQSTTNFQLNQPVTVDVKALGDLSVNVESTTEADFDSMVSPTQVREHKRSIDDEFEKLLMDSSKSSASTASSPTLDKEIERNIEASTPIVPKLKPDSDDWVLLPDADEKKELESLKVDTNTRPPNLNIPNTLDTQINQTVTTLTDDKPVVVALSPKHNRYSSPLFENLLSMPIEPVRLSQSFEEKETLKTTEKTEKIPDDQSISKLLQTASLVASIEPKTKVVETVENTKLTPTNSTNDAKSEEVLDEEFLKQFSVPEKRSSIQDPEKVLMENVVPGSIAEREHRKWLHAAPIANNPYSTEALQRRLSETDQKQKSLDLANNTKIVDALVEESSEANADKDENEEVFQRAKIDIKKYKRDYYINDATEAHLNRTSYGSSSSKSPSLETDDDRSDNIIPSVTVGGKGFSPRTLLSSDIDTNTTAGGSIVSDQDIVSVSQENSFSSPKSEKSNDNSLTYSEDSDTTRIYNLNTGETKIVVPTVESPVKLGQQFFGNSLAKTTHTIRKMDDEVTTVIRTSNRSLHNGNNVTDYIVKEIYEEKQVIEPEVVESLPSVKKLAQIYGKDTSPSQDVQVNKPKSFIATSENGSETIVPHQAITKTTSETSGPNYENNYHPAAPIASITARSIPSQIRADLKKSISYDEESIVRQGDREGSPEIQPGVTRNSIAFFENLKKN